MERTVLLRDITESFILDELILENMKEKIEEINPVDYAILEYLTQEKKGRLVDIARGTGINDKTVWQALQRLLVRKWVEKDKFNIYTITKEGIRVRENIDMDRSAIKTEILLQRIRRKKDILQPEEIQVLENIAKAIERR